MSNQDNEMIQDFVEEASELVQSIEEGFLQLEKTGENPDPEIINTLFRGVHTIKGSSSFLGLSNIGKLSHSMETIMSRMREGVIGPEPVYIDALLSATDILGKMIADVGSSEGFAIGEILEILNHLIEGKPVEPGATSPVKREDWNQEQRENKNSSPSMNGNSQSGQDLGQAGESQTNRNGYGTSPAADPGMDREILEGFIFEARKYLDNLDDLFSELDRKSGEELDGMIVRVYRAINAIKGTSGFIGLSRIYRLAASIEDYINRVRLKLIPLHSEHVDSLLMAKDRLGLLVDDVENSERVSIDEELESLAKIGASIGFGIPPGGMGGESVQTIENQSGPRNSPGREPATIQVPVPVPEVIKEKVQPENENQVPAPAPAPITSPVTGGNGEAKGAENPRGPDTIRISVDLMDKLMRLAGELVLIRNQQLRISSELEGTHREMVQRLDGVTSEIQETVMKTRLQPVGTVFSKLPRIVRDINKELGKDIQVTVLGSEVELDKNILESLAAPLTHIVRNAGDHGVETPEERRGAGKAPSGSIVIEAYHEGGLIHIVIKDDGRGLDPGFIASRAVERGLKNPGEIASMSKNEIINLIMLPGFSTRDTVTSFSGRGVGMDVVKTAIEKLNGSIEILSTKGEGTTFLLKLPLTLAIIPSLIVSSVGIRYAIPQVNLDELVSIDPTAGEGGIESAGGQEVYRLRGSLLPIVRLGEILARPRPFNGTVKKEIITKYKRSMTAPVLDEPMVEENLLALAGGGEVGRKSAHPISGYGESGSVQESYLLKRRREETIHIAIMSAGNRKYGLVIDSIDGTEEIVVKPVHPSLRKLKIYSGATILGDGKVSLILDAEGIASHGTVDFNTSPVAFNEGNQGEFTHGRIESVLVFHSGPSEQFAISLQMISHIKEVGPHQITMVGEKAFISLDGTSYRVIKLEDAMEVSPLVMKEEMFLLLIKHVKEPVGILISDLVDIMEINIDLRSFGFVREGLLGSAMVKDTMTLFVDVHQVFEMVEPDVFGNRNRITGGNGESGANPPVPSGKTRILLVEDSSIFRQMLSRYLEAEGYTITIAEDGQAGLRAIESQEFDLIVSDLEMPNMDGFEFIKSVRNRSSLGNVPALALSSLNDEKAIRRALDSGFDAYEIKLEREHFLDRVTRLLQGGR